MTKRGVDVEKGTPSQNEPERARASQNEPEEAALSKPIQSRVRAAPEPRPSRARVRRPNRTPPSRSSSSWTSSPRTPSAHRGGASVACCAHARGSPAHRTSRLAHEGSCALMSTAAWTSVPDMEQADPDPMWTPWRSSSLKELRHPALPRGGRQSTRQE